MALGFFKKSPSFGLSPELVQKIEDAILLGNVRELDDVLSDLADNEDVPTDFRRDLEALRHFRAHYGEGGEVSVTHPLQKQKAVVLERSWSAELLERLRTQGDSKKRTA
ncbi:MAG: hypothetical protein JO126_06350 [Alphaproteobacteria bacterium]|nr:hypothetical protein [Alphaproteobacteria bacterium]MBV8549059.1 hypothetical protein [Alphaproteobacteria bacterium]